MSDLPVWLLDVDDVVNASRPCWGTAPYTARVQDAFGMEWKLRWAPKLLERIRVLQRSGTVEIVWCTTWCPEARQLERLWGLPELQCAWTAPKFGFDAVEAKQAAALETVRAGRRLIWTDDDAIPTVGELVDELEAAGALLIRPKKNRGLQPDDMDAIEAFIGAAKEALNEAAE
jgi:hypothetical protein